MSKEENKIVPQLRFPEFLKDCNWYEKPLIETADKKVKWSFTGGPFGSNLKASDYTESGFRIVQLQNIGDGEFNDDSKIFTSTEKADELLSCNIYGGDIIISKMGDPVGRACIIPRHLERCVMASDGIRLKVDEKRNSKYFIFSLINSKPIRKAIEAKSTGSTRKRIGLNDLKEIKLPIPKNPKEQQKIANCLSSLDDVINAETEKLDLLQDHKKGLLQQLFPANGETKPKFRFPEFVDDGDWIKTTLGNICKFKKGKGLPKSAIIEKGSKPCIHYGQLFTVYTEVIRTVKNYTDMEDGILSKKDDVLMPTSDVTPRGLAKASCIKDKNVVLGGDILIIRTDENIVFGEFLSRYIRYLENEVLKYVSGSTVFHLYASSMKLLELFLPSIEEQQKIANCLTSVDELIESQQQKIEGLKAHKKGLLQKLFPTIKN